MHVCADFTGHGVGHLLHMPPAIFHCCTIASHLDYPQYRETMKVGQVFTIEPIITLFPLHGNSKIWADKFTAISENNPNAQF
jgi:methionyl aminopeptidase